MIRVIDLKGLFGNRYRIVREEGFAQTSTDPWGWIIPGKYGEIYPYGGHRLCVMATSIGVANKMRNWPELEIHQDAADAVVFKFRIEHFPKVARRIMARRKRQVSVEYMKKIGRATAYRTRQASSDATSPERRGRR